MIAVTNNYSKSDSGKGSMFLYGLYQCNGSGTYNGPYTASLVILITIFIGFGCTSFYDKDY